MLENQDGACNICLEKLEGLGATNLCVDHCHATGKIRGLLCRNCNKGLGFFKDNSKNLMRAFTYIEQQKYNIGNT